MKWKKIVAYFCGYWNLCGLFLAMLFVCFAWVVWIQNTSMVKSHYCFSFGFRFFFLFSFYNSPLSLAPERGQLQRWTIFIFKKQKQQVQFFTISALFYRSNVTEKGHACLWSLSCSWSCWWRARAIVLQQHIFES